jgi:hypothetical protein
VCVRGAGGEGRGPGGAEVEGRSDIALLAEELRAMRTRENENGLDLLGTPGAGDDLKFHGAKGAVAWQGEALRHKRPGSGRRELNEIYEASRRLVGAEDERQVFIFPDVLRRLPFRGDAVKKRSMKMALRTAQHLRDTPECAATDRACGSVAATIRWLALSLFTENQDIP